MIQTIQWHETALKNATEQLTFMREAIARAERDYARTLESCMFRRKQIDEARRRGMHGFDPDRLMVRKAKR